MSETMQEKIQLATIKLKNLTVSADQMAEFLELAMTQYERYITYSILRTRADDDLRISVLLQTAEYILQNCRLHWQG